MLKKKIDGNHNPFNEGKKTPHHYDGEECIAELHKKTGDTTEIIASGYDAALKTIVLWIYNINQNGTANKFHEDMSRYFSNDKDDNVILKDMEPEVLAEFLSNLTTTKEITLPGLGVRLILLIYNCNQNGVSNSAEIPSLNGLPLRNSR